MSLLIEDVLGLIREDVRDLSAYHVQDSIGMVKLDAMENPFPLPDPIFKSWQEKLKTIHINRYPDPSAKVLREKLSEMLDLAPADAIMFGNGSDELIQLIMLGLAKDGAKILSIEPSFVMYRMIAGFCGLDYLGVDLTDTFELDMEHLEQTIIKHQPSVIFIAQPNNPTGTLFKEEQLRKIASISKGLLVLDEAYSPFTDFDSAPLLKGFDNVLVMRTLSKAGLAGLRLGYLIGKKELIEQFEKLRLPYNINVLTQSLASSALEHYELLEQQALKIVSLREELFNALNSIRDIEVIPSEANFLTVRLKNSDTERIAQGMREDGVLIKKLDGSHPLLEHCLRLTVGTDEENSLMLSSLKRQLCA